MGLFDHLFKSKSPPSEENSVETGNKPTEPAKHSEPAARGVTPSRADPAGFLHPKNFVPRGMAPLGPQKSGAISNVRKPGAPAAPTTPPVDEIVLTLGDVLSRIPSPYLKLGQHDPKRELRFSINDLSSDIARGRAAVPLSRIAQLVPDIFVKEISADEDTEVRLPLQKLVEQIGLLRSRPAGERGAVRQSASSTSAGSTLAPPSFKVEFPEPLIENASPGPDTLSGMLSSVDPVFELKPAEGSIFLRPTQEPTFELKPSAELTGAPFTLAPETPPVAQPTIPSSEKSIAPETRGVEPAAREASHPKEAPKIEIGEFERIFAQFAAEPPAQTSKIESVTPELPAAAAVEVSSVTAEPPVAERSPSLVEAAALSVETAPAVVEKVDANAEPLRPASASTSSVVTEPILPSGESVAVNAPPAPEPKIEIASPVVAEVAAPRPAKEVVIMAAPVQLRPAGQTPPPPTPPAVAAPGLTVFEPFTPAPPVANLVAPSVASDLPSADVVSRMEILAQPVEKASPPVAADLAMPAPAASNTPPPISGEAISATTSSTPPAEITPSSIPKLPFIERLLSAVLPPSSAVLPPAPAEEIPTGSALSPLPPAAPVVESKEVAAGAPVALDVPSVERVDVAPIPEAPVGVSVEASSSFESKPQSPLEPAISSPAIPGPIAAPLAPAAEPSTSCAEPARPVGENISAAPPINIPALSLVPDGGAPSPLPVEALTADAPREQDPREQHREAAESAASPSRPEAEMVSSPVVEPRAAEPEPSPVAPEPSPVVPAEKSALPVAQMAAPEAPQVMHPEFADPGREYAASVLAGTVLPKESIGAAPAGLAADGPKSDAAPESAVTATWPDRESVESAGTPVGLEATAPEVAPAPEKKIVSAETPQFPPVVVRESPAPADTGRERIQLSLAAILKQCPRELIVGELPAIPDSVRITLPFAPIDRQLVAGHVEISAVRFIAAIPFTYQKYFTARIGVKVPIPLEEVFQNLPNPSKEEPVVSGPAPQILAPAVPEDLVIPDEVIPPPPPIFLAGPTRVEEPAEPVLAVEPQPVSAITPPTITAPLSTRPDEETPSATIPVSTEPHLSTPAATAPSSVAPAFTIPVAAAPVLATPVAAQPTTVVPPSETVPVADVPPIESAAEPAVAAEKAPEPVADVPKPQVAETSTTPEALTPELGVVPVAPAISDAPVVEMVTLVAPSTLPAEPESIPASAPAVTSLDLSMGHHIVPPPPIVIPEPEATEAEIPLAGTPFDGISEEGATQLAPVELAPVAKTENESGPQPIEPSPTKIAQHIELHAPKPEHDSEEHGPKPELEVEAPQPEHHAAMQAPQPAPESETPPPISSELPPNVPVGDTPEPVTNMDEQVISPTELEKQADTTPKTEEPPVAKDETVTPEVSSAAALGGEAPTLSVAGETTQTFRLPQMIRPMIVLPPPIFGFSPTPSDTAESSTAEAESKAVEPEVIQDKEKETTPPVESTGTQEVPVEVTPAPAESLVSAGSVESAQPAAVTPVEAAVESPAPAVVDAAISSEPMQDASVVEVLPPLSIEAAAISAEEKSASAPRTFVMEGQFVEAPRAFVPPSVSEPVAEPVPAEPAVVSVSSEVAATLESAPAPETPAAEIAPAPAAEAVPVSPEVAVPAESAPAEKIEVVPSAESTPAPEATPAPAAEVAPVVESAGEYAPSVIEAPGAELASAAPVVEPAVSSDAVAAPIPAAEPDQLAASLGIPEAAPAVPVEGTAGESPLLHLPRIIEQFADAEVLPPPALPLRRFDQDALQALFMTEEVLDLPKISRMAAQLPGVHACVIATRDQACTGGTLPEGFDLAALLGLAPRVGEAAGRMPIGALKHFTLYGEHYSVSFFARNGLSLCAVHRPRSFVPGVREKLVAIADELSK